MATESANSKTMPFSKRFKLKLFFLFHNLLLFKDIGPYLGTALLLLQLVQSLVLTFNGKNKYLGSYFFGYIIKDIDVIQLYPIVDRYFDTNTRIVMNVFLLAFVVGISLSLIIMANRTDYTQNVGLQNIAYLLGYFYEFTTKLLFVPIFGTFIITLKCEEGTIQCFSGQHIILLATSIVGIILLLLVSYTIDAFFFDFSFKSKDSLAHAPVSDFVLNFIYKTVAVILTVGVFDLEYSSLVALYHIVFNAFFLFNSIKKVTYFDIKVHVMNLIASATLAWTNASLVVVDLVEFELLRNNTIFIIIAGSVFFVSLCRNVREKTQDNLLTKEAVELESDILLDSKVRFFFKLARSARNDSQSDLLLASLIKIHIDHCADAKCPCKTRGNLYDPKRHVFGETKQMPHKDQTFIKHFIYNMLRNGSIKFFNSELLFLDSVFFLFEAMRNYPQAYHLIHLYEKKNMSNNPRMAMQFIIYRLYAKMQNYSMNRNMKVNTTILPYEKVIEFDEEFASLKTMVFSQIEHYINVWEMIDSEFPDLNILNKLLDKTFNHKEKVIKQYETTLKVNDQSASMMVLMNTYARFVAYDDELAARVEAEIEPRLPMDNHSDNFNFSRDMGRWNIFDQDCYTIEIANQMDRLGQITNFSKNALGLLGYQDQELRFQNVKILIPRVIAIQHDRILKDFFMNGQDSGLRQPMHNFSINSRGYCFSCHLIIKAIPMHGHYRLMSLFRKLNQYDYLITDEKGTIDAFGEKIGQLLELTPQTIQQSRLNLALIAPKTIKYFHYYLIKKEKGLMENSLNKTRSFYIFIPNNWKSLLQRWQEKRKGKNAISIPSLNSGGQENDDINDMDEYYHNMLDYMMKDSKPNYKKAVKVKAIIEHITLRNGEIQMKSLKIVSFKEKNMQDIPPEKIRKQHAFIPILAKKISKLLDQKKKEMAHQLELARLKAEENEAAEKAAEEEENAEAGIEAPAKKEQKEAKKPQKGGWGNIVDKAKKRGSKKSEKSFEALMHADSDNSEKGLNDDRDEDESLDGMSVDPKTPKTDTKVGSQISRTGTEKTLMKKPSILKKKSMKDDFSDKNPSGWEKVKKRVKITLAENKKKNVVIAERFDDSSPTSPVKEKKKEKDAAKKMDKQLAYVSLLTEESSSYDGYDLADKEDLRSMESNKVVNKERKQMLKELAEQGIKEAKDMIEKKDLGPSSVASSASYQAKDFSLKLKGLLKAEYVPASLRMSNKTEVLLTLTVLVLVNILSAITRSQVSEWINSIETMNTPNLYEVYLFKTMDSYLTLDLRSTSVLDSTIYDTTWFDKDQAEREEMYTQIRLLKKVQIEDATIEEDLYSLYFTSTKYNYITKGAAEQRSRDFSGYLNLFMNAINMTLNYDISKYQNVEDDEFLYILNNNFFITLDFLSQQKAILKSNIANTLDVTRSLITAEQASGISIILGSMLIIIPMFLLHNLHLEEVLVLFTNVSKRDSDVYYRHYRTIRLTWNAHYEDPYNLQKEVLEEAKIEDINKKRSKLSTNSKSRPFIPLKKDYKKFIIVLGASLLFYAALATVKALTIRTSLDQIEEYLEDFEDLSEEASSVFKILHNYKLLLNTAVKGGIPTAQDLADYSNRLRELDQYGDSSLSVADQKTVGISETNIDHLKSISVSNVCDLLDDPDKPECTGLFKGVLQRGFLVIRSDLHAFTKNYFARFTEVLNTDPAGLDDLSKQFLNDQDLKDYLTAWTFIQEVIFDWLHASYADMQSKENEMISLYNLFLGLICFSLVLNLATWRYSYQQLVQTLFKFHRYFEILPLELIQNNRSMRSYFERYFRLKEKR